MKLAAESRNNSCEDHEMYEIIEKNELKKAQHLAFNFTIFLKYASR